MHLFILSFIVWTLAQKRFATYAAFATTPNTADAKATATNATTSTAGSVAGLLSSAIAGVKP